MSHGGSKPAAVGCDGGTAKIGCLATVRSLMEVQVRRKAAMSSGTAARALWRGMEVERHRTCSSGTLSGRRWVQVMGAEEALESDGALEQQA